MGVDTDTYRSRVGLFVPSRGAGMLMMPFVIDFSHVVKLIGAVSFVRILLFMAGIEQNPGPPDKFIFRYQYLLIEIGTGVLRTLFDILVNNDFMQYLNVNPTQNGQLKFLMNKDIITDAQKKFLPPLDMKPNSSNFDVTLLACLLRNVCGLRGRKDAVWQSPAPTDLSIEADITRLRECRNDLLHSGTVFMSETDLTSKWNELSDILNRLNNTCKIADLPTRISDAEHMDIDEEVKRHYHEIMIKGWYNIDRLVDHGLSELIKKFEDFGKELAEIKANVTEIEKCLVERRQTEASDIQEELKNKYLLNCTTITVSPLFKFENEELLKLYKIPTFFVTVCHGAQLNQKDIEVTSCKQIFYKEDQECRNIYIIGDAGVGKTSFCQFLCLVWYKSKSCVEIVNEEMKEYVDFIEKFDFVFYITLRDSDRIDVIAMIVDQLIFTQSLDEWHKMYSCVKDILKEKECLVILDGLDEWKPDARGKKDISTPSKTFSGKCIFLTTCRPYKTENLQLRKDLDHQVKITGITGKSSTDYIKDVVEYINNKNDENKDPERFKTEVTECCLADLLCVPIITSHLVVVWFEQKLTNMSRTLIYGNIVDMLFEIAVKREIEFPPSTASEIQLPDSLSKLNYVNKHVSLLQKVCLLSFRSLFNQDECVATLVFTRQQLESDPYFLYPEQMDLLCKIGILSKNKINRRFGKQEEKLNFLHLSYLEFFAALFVTSFDSTNIFNDIVVKNWTSISHVLPFKNFFLFLAGFSIQTVDQLFCTIYPLISNDLTTIRRQSIFHYEYYLYKEQLKSLQSIVISCIMESRRSGDANVFIKLEDFFFEDNSNIEILKPLIVLNKACTQSLYSVHGKYLDIFDQIKNLQCLNVDVVLPAAYKRFTQFMLENKSILHTVSINGGYKTRPLIPELPVSSLQHLTSLSLSCVKMQPNHLQSLVIFLSDNVLIENILLRSIVYCDNIKQYDTLTLNLQHHKKLTSLIVWRVNALLVCNNVNNSSLKFMRLWPFSKRIARCYNDVFNCFKDSQLERLCISGSTKWLDNNTLKTLVHTVNTLPYINVLALFYMKLPDDVLLQLHPDVTQVKIKLIVVTMSRQCFHSFIEGFVNNKTDIEVVLYACKIASVDGLSPTEMSVKESWDYMSEYLTSIPTVNITHAVSNTLVFETTSCQ